jgi:hypothetical protein
MTIYRLYAQNGDRAGFWVQHRTWSNLCAQVQSVAGREAGRLPGAVAQAGDAPAQMRGFDVRSGRPMPLSPSPSLHDRNYAVIAEPGWFHNDRLRS